MLGSLRARPLRHGVTKISPTQFELRERDFMPENKCLRVHPRARL